MPNSNSVLHSLREEVIPNDGRRETLWVALSILGILLLSVLGIHWRQDPGESASLMPVLSTFDQQRLTELSIALEELTFMMPTDTYPSLEMIQAAGIPPFDQGLTWQELSPGCYHLSPTSTHAGFVLALWHRQIWLHLPVSYSLHPVGQDCLPQDHWISTR